MNRFGSHIIKAQEYQIQLDDRHDAYQVQSTISKLQSTQIESLLNTILNKYEIADCIFQFDTIELDLGTINKFNYESELVYRLEEALIHYFNSILLANGELRVGNVLKLGDLKINQLEHFLLRGFIPWNSEINLSPTKLINEVLKESIDSLISLLKNLGKIETVRKRMIFQFPEELLDTIVINVAGNSGKYLVTYKDNIIKYQSETPMIDAGAGPFRQAVWEVILAYIFVESKGYYDKKSFLKYLIDKISQKYNLSYRVLLQHIARGIKSDQKLTNDSLEFNKIINELEEQEDLRSSSIVGLETTKLENIVAWLTEFDQFFKTGRFSPHTTTISRNIFNIKLKKLLNLQNKTVISYVTNWIRNRDKKERLLAYADNSVIDQIVVYCPPLYIDSIGNFLMEIKKHKAMLSSDANKLLKTISSQTAKLTLQTFDQSSLSVKEIILRYLEHILASFDGKEAILFELLDNINQYLPKHLKVTISLFLSKFYHNLGKKVIHSIIDEIEQFLMTHDSSLLDFWSDKHWLDWCRKTGLSKEQLIKQLKQNTLSGPLANSLPLFFDNNFEQSLDISRNKINLSTAVHDNFSHEKSEQIILYIIETGHFPWWSKSLSLDKFNVIFSALWKETKIKEKLALAIKRNSFDSSFTRFLEASLFLQVITDLTNASEKSNLDFLHKVLMITAGRFRVLGIITQLELQALKRDIFSALITTSTIRKDIQLLKVLQNWINSTGISNSKIAQQELKFLVSGFSQKYPTNYISSEFSKFLKRRCPMDTPNSISSNISKLSLYEFVQLEFEQMMEFIPSTKLTLLDRLEILQQKKPKFLNALLAKVDFRYKLLNEMSEKDLRDFIVLPLQANQQIYFSSTIFLLDNLQKLLTVQELKKIKQEFLQMLMLVINSGVISTWNSKNWHKLVMHSIASQIGKRKSLLILSNLRHKDLGAIQIGSESFYDTIFEDSLINNKILTSKKKPLNKEYKKLGDDEPRLFSDAIFIRNAGLILIAPYLGMLFSKCDLLDNSKFRDNQSIYRGIQLLAYAATGSIATNESDLVLNKLLCGLKIEDPVDIFVTISAEEKETVDELLAAIIQHWTALGSTTIDGLRTSFLQRDGKLEEDQLEHFLIVEQKAYDMLLDQIPWNITKIKLSWMKKIIQVTWR